MNAPSELDPDSGDTQGPGRKRLATLVPGPQSVITTPYSGSAIGPVALSAVSEPVSDDSPVDAPPLASVPLSEPVSDDSPDDASPPLELVASGSVVAGTPYSGSPSEVVGSVPVESTPVEVPAEVPVTVNPVSVDPTVDVLVTVVVSVVESVPVSSTPSSLGHPARHSPSSIVEATHEVVVVCCCAPPQWGQRDSWMYTSRRQLEQAIKSAIDNHVRRSCAGGQSGV